MPTNPRQLRNSGWVYFAVSAKSTVRLEISVATRVRGKATLAWALWLATFGCCAAGLLITLALIRPRTLAVLAIGGFSRWKVSGVD